MLNIRGQHLIHSPTVVSVLQEFTSYLPATRQRRHSPVTQAEAGTWFIDPPQRDDRLSWPKQVNVNILLKDIPRLSVPSGKIWTREAWTSWSFAQCANRCASTVICKETCKDLILLRLPIFVLIWKSYVRKSRVCPNLRMRCCFSASTMEMPFGNRWEL